MKCLSSIKIFVKITLIEYVTYNINTFYNYFIFIQVMKELFSSSFQYQMLLVFNQMNINLTYLTVTEKRN